MEIIWRGDFDNLISCPSHGHLRKNTILNDKTIKIFKTIENAIDT